MTFRAAILLALVLSCGCNSEGICMDGPVCRTDVAKSSCQGTWAPYNANAAGDTRTERGKSTCHSKGFVACGSESECRSK
jgi:hypothetical protein